MVPWLPWEVASFLHRRTDNQECQPSFLFDCQPGMETKWFQFQQRSTYDGNFSVRQPGFSLQRCFEQRRGGLEQGPTLRQNETSSPRSSSLQETSWQCRLQTTVSQRWCWSPPLEIAPSVVSLFQSGSQWSRWRRWRHPASGCRWRGIDFANFDQRESSEEGTPRLLWGSRHGICRRNDQTRHSVDRSLGLPSGPSCPLCLWRQGILCFLQAPQPAGNGSLHFGSEPWTWGCGPSGQTQGSQWPGPGIHQSSICSIFFLSASLHLCLSCDRRWSWTLSKSSTINDRSSINDRSWRQNEKCCQPTSGWWRAVMSRLFYR